MSDVSVGNGSFTHTPRGNAFKAFLKDKKVAIPVYLLLLIVAGSVIVGGVLDRSIIGQTASTIATTPIVVTVPAQKSANAAIPDTFYESYVRQHKEVQESLGHFGAIITSVDVVPTVLESEEVAIVRVYFTIEDVEYWADFTVLEDESGAIYLDSFAEVSNGDDLVVY